MKVSDQSDPLKETFTYAVLDDQSTDVFITDALQSKLNLSGAEVNLQVNTIVGTDTVRMRRVPGLQIQDINGEYSPVKVPYAYAQPKIPATHSDIATLHAHWKKCTYRLPTPESYLWRSRRALGREIQIWMDNHRSCLLG